MDTAKIAQYIISQIRAGLTPDDIAAQLRGAGWQEADITAGFAAAQAQIAPPAQAPASQPQTPDAAAANQPTAGDTPAQPAPIQPLSQPTPEELTTQPREVARVDEQIAAVTDAAAASSSRQQLPPPIKRGRIKTGWLLFKQSFAVIKANPALWRYMVMSMLVTLVLFIGMVVVVVIDINTANVLTITDTSDNTSPTLLGYGVFALFTLAITAITFYYAAALSSHVLSIFREEQSQYDQHIKTARSKLPAIITFALITVVIGFILRQLEQRFRLIGWIVSKIVGVLWALATTFVISIIADSDASGSSAIKQSIGLFKQNWAETVTSRVTLGGALFLVYFLVMIPVMVGLVIGLGGLFGFVGVLIAIALFFVGIIILAILETLATNILNVCLYYYAKYGVIPPSFSPELLASVFVEKKSKKK